MLNTILTIVMFVAAIVGVIIFYLRRRNQNPEIEIEEKLTLDSLLYEVKVILADKFKDEFFFGKDDSEWEAAYAAQQRIQSAAKNCVFGVEKDKIVIKGLIKSILRNKFPTEEDLSYFMDFNAEYKEPMLAWETMLYYLKKKHGKDAVSYLIHTYGWKSIRHDIEDGTVAIHGVTTEEMMEAYYKEVPVYIPFTEQLDILATVVFSQYKGFGCIDTLREMNIDGINCGTSGSILAASKVDEDLKAPRSVWIYFEGVYIHLRFLTFYTEEELRRVTLLVCRYKSPGPLTEKRSYIINKMEDRSRVLAMRPNAGEYWGLFIRKFTLPKVDLDLLYITEKDEVDAVIPITLIKYLARTLVTTALTGRQGSGKTTALIGLVKYLSALYNIRVLEAATEMNLREHYPARPIYSVAETQYIAMEELQDAIKKSDGGITIIGEVAKAAVAARMIELGMVATEATYFTHHAMTARDLVKSLRNNLVEAGSLTNELTAEQQVVQVVRCNVHFELGVDGKRRIARITEIIPLEENLPYPEIDPNNLEYSKAEIEREYYYRQTDRSSFTTRDIVVFDKKEQKYKAVGWFSPELTELMKSRLQPEYREEFRTFVGKYWG